MSRFYLVENEKIKFFADSLNFLWLYVVIETNTLNNITMQSNYFPYSQIIASNDTSGNDNTVIRHKYFGDWQVSTTIPQPEPRASFPSISEIYY